MPAESAAVLRWGIAGGAVLVLLIGWWLYRGSPQSRAEALFSDIESGLEGGSVRGVLGRIHDSYDFFGLWPRLGQLDGSDGREAARQALRGVCWSQRDNAGSRDFTYRIESLEPLGNGRYQASVSFELHFPGGGPWSLPATRKHPFTLVDEGWLLPSMSIVDHGPIRFGN
jgi:hypothetical protein